MYSKKIKYLRESQKISQKEIAQILNISTSRYTHLENEDEIIPIKHLNTLCNLFDVSFDYIFDFTETKQYENSLKELDCKKSSINLKTFRKNNKLTQVKLAEVLNIAKGTIANYECGRNLIATPFLYTISKKYNISADYLLGKINEIKKN